MFELVGWWGLVVLAVPLVAMALSTQFTLSPHRRRIWIAMSVVIAIEVATGFMVYLFPAGFLVYGVVRANKIEGPRSSSRAGRAAAAAQAADADGDVDEADEAVDEASEKS